MKEVLKTLANGAKALVTHKSNARISIEKSAKLYVAPVAILGAGMLILDGFATWKSNMRTK